MGNYEKYSFYIAIEAVKIDILFVTTTIVTKQPGLTVELFHVRLENSKRKSSLIWQ